MVTGFSDIWMSILKNNYLMLGLDKSKPREIIILGLLVGLGAISHLISGFTNQPLYILGNLIASNISFYVYLFYAFVSVILAYGLINLKKTAYYIFLIWFCWGALNGFSSYLATGDFAMLIDAFLCIIFIVFIYSKNTYFVN